MKVVVEQYHPQQQLAKSNAPVTLTWNNARMIRNHSIRACVKEILTVNRGIDVVKINLIGSPSTGKTTLAKTLAHLIHTISWEKTKTPYAVKVFSRAELLDMENTLSKLEPMNHVMIFDDVSWLIAGNNKSKLDQVQKTFTEIRHLPGGQDVKVIIIFNFHYNLSIPKHLRQAHFFGYTDLGSSELENTQKLVGIRNTPKIEEFRRACYEAGSTYKEATEDTPEKPATFSYKLGKMGKFTYTYRKPFAPALWWNNNSLRHIVYPAREWINPICDICSINKTSEQTGDVSKLKEVADRTYGESRIRNAIRIILYRRGINTFAPEIQRAVWWLERELSIQQYSTEELMKAYDLEVVKTFSKHPSMEKQITNGTTEENTD